MARPTSKSSTIVFTLAAACVLTALLFNFALVRLGMGGIAVPLFAVCLGVLWMLTGMFRWFVPSSTDPDPKWTPWLYWVNGAVFCGFGLVFLL